MLSVRQLIYQNFRVPITVVTPPYPNTIRLTTEGRVMDFRRPQWTISRLNHRVVSYGAGGYRDDCLWQLIFYGYFRKDVDLVLSQLHYSIQNDITGRDLFDVIPGYRFNWQYPQPDVQPNVVTPGPGLPAGTYYVRVSGFDMCGNESAASVPVLVTLANPNNALRVRILRAPSQVPMFYAYNIYVNNHLEIAGLLQPGMRAPLTGGPPVVVGGSNTVYAIAVISNILGTGVVPKEPSNSVPVRWKFMKVNNYSDYTREDDEEDGVFNGIVTMETSVMQEREQPQADVIRQIGMSIKVLTPILPIPPADPFIITSTNKVIVSVS